MLIGQLTQKERRARVTQWVRELQQQLHWDTYFSSYPEAARAAQKRSNGLSPRNWDSTQKGDNWPTPNVAAAHSCERPLMQEPGVGRGTAKTRSSLSRRRLLGGAVLNILLLCLARGALASEASTPADLVAYIQKRFELSEAQARGALGALLVYARQRLQKSEFDILAANVPNAQRIMRDVQIEGIVTGPLADLDDYEKSLSNLGIGQPLASQIVPAVIEYLAATGHDLERDILTDILT